MIENGDTVEDIQARFKNDYDEKEIKRFIPKDTITAAEKEKRDETKGAEDDAGVESPEEMEARIRAELVEETKAADDKKAADKKAADKKAADKKAADKKAADDKKDPLD
jgi:membrane protein involved in colicin uptake